MPLPNKLQEILDKLAEQTDSLVLDANKDVKGLEKRLFNSLTQYVAGFDKDKSGRIKPNRANIKKLTTLNKFLNDSIVDEKYLKQVNGFLSSLNEAQSTIAEYFKESEVGFENDKAFNELVDNVLVDPIRNTLTQEGLSQSVSTQIKKAVTGAVVGGYSPDQLLEELSLLIVGDDKKGGALSRHVGQVTTDAANQYVATYFEVISGDLGLEFYLYEGSKKDSTRHFCTERFGQYFHKKEIESWASLNWGGKIPSTNSSNIFVYRGGYNCRHQIIPVSTAIVPKEVLKRAADKGYYSLDPKLN